MAAHRLTIAKATFQAGLLRPDASCAPVTRDEIVDFHQNLDATLTRCSPDNVQRTKTWCLRHITSSGTRTGALGKYLVAAAKAQAPAEESQKRAKGDASWQRRRLHVLYVLNDLLHHAKNHERERSVHIQLTSALQPHLVEAVSLAATVDGEVSAKLPQKLEDLLNVWADEAHYSAEYISKLREAADNASQAGLSGIQQKTATNGTSACSALSATPKDAPFVMPASHGDTLTPYYDLPAANMLPHIMPNSTVPINTQLLKPLHFVAGPADPMLATAVKGFLAEVDRIYDPTLRYHEDEGIVADIDDMGQAVRKDEQTGEVLGGETYYGWSRDFCERMKKRKSEGPPKEEQRNGRGRGISQSRSSSLSEGRRKRPRYSESRSRSRSYSRSRSRPRFGNAQRRSYSRSPEPRSRHASPRRPDDPSVHKRTPPPQELRAPHQSFTPAPPAPPSSSPFNPNPAFNAPFGLDQNGMPLPPPRPAGWQGPWPPMPPPLPQGMPHIPAMSMPQLPMMPGMSMGMGMPNMNMGMGMGFGTQSSPQQQQMQSSPPAGLGGWQGQQQYGQGRGGWNGNGYGRGRGRGR